jgi:hypothetical protein
MTGAADLGFEIASILAADDTGWTIDPRRTGLQR